jgi:hypothetical protein
VRAFAVADENHAIQRGHIVQRFGGFYLGAHFL